LAEFCSKNKNELLETTMYKMTPENGPQKTSQRSVEAIAIKATNAVSAMIAYWNSDQICLFANKAYLSWFGKSQEEMLGISIKQLLGPLYEKNLSHILEALKGRTQTFERSISLPNGLVRHSLATYTPDIENGIVKGFTAHVADVTEMKFLELELQAEKTRLAAVIDHSPAVIYVKDLSGKHLLINKQFETIFNLSNRDVIGKVDQEIFPKEFAEKYRANDEEVIRKKIPMEFDETAPHADGLHHYLSVKFPLLDHRKEVYAICGILTDITERKSREDDQMKLEKLGSLGLLAGGIAHDFNNILTGILGNISLAKSLFDSQEQLLNRLDEAERASLRASDLAQQLLTFSKGGTPIKKMVSMQRMIEHSVKFALSGSNVQRHIAFQDGLWPAEVDEGQMNQVIQNLVINAQQAMPSGGTIQIEVNNLAIEEEVGRGLGLRNGNYLTISIKDQGIGIPKELLNKIFDPYFTTKVKGSGLGLSISHSIIKRHQGYITAESKPGSGTTFLIYLPASATVSVPVEKIEEEKLSRGKGSVLIIDDEEDILNIVGEILRHLGYDVILARSGSEAVELYQLAKDTGKAIDLIITDLTVPGGMGGVETLRRLLEIDPLVKAIVSSGYSNDPAMAEFEKFGFAGRLLKPYRAVELSVTVKNAMKMRRSND
jgi:PAS domain S-box-containing protein